MELVHSGEDSQTRPSAGGALVAQLPRVRRRGGVPSSRSPRRPQTTPGRRRRSAYSLASDGNQSANREVLRRALNPPPTRPPTPLPGLRSWLFRPTPSPLSKMSLE